MSNTKPFSNNTGLLRYGPFAVDFITDTAIPIGSIQYTQERLVIEHVWVDFTNVNGTRSQEAIAIVNNGTTGQNVSSSTTFTSAVTDGSYALVIPQPSKVITGSFTVDSVDILRYPNLLITQKAIGQATTFRERTDNVATVTTAAVHGLVDGDVTRVASMGDATYDGLVTVLSTPTTSSFTYFSEGADETSTADTAGRVGAVQAQVSVVGYLREVSH